MIIFLTSKLGLFEFLFKSQITLCADKNQVSVPAVMKVKPWTLVNSPT